MIEIIGQFDIKLPRNCTECSFSDSSYDAECKLGALFVGNNGLQYYRERLAGCPLREIEPEQGEPPSNARWFYKNLGEHRSAAMLGCGKFWVDPVEGGIIGSETKKEAEKFAEDEADPGYTLFWATEEDFKKIFER